MLDEKNTPDSDDKNEKYNRTYQFSTAQILTFFTLTCVLLFASGSSWSSARSAEAQVLTQSLALRQMQAEIAKITELRRTGGLTQEQGEQKWGKIVKTLMRTQTRAHQAKVEEKAAQLALNQTKTQYESAADGEKDEAQKALVKAQGLVAAARSKVISSASVAQKAKAVLKARTDQQSALKSVAEAEKTKTEDPAGMKKAVEALAQARIRTKLFSVGLTEAESKRWRDKSNREIKKVEYASVASENSEDTVIKVEKEETEAEIQLSDAQHEGVDTKPARKKLEQVTQIADAANSAHAAAIAKTSAVRSAAGAVGKVQGLLSQLAVTQKKNINDAAPGSQVQRLVEQLKEQITEAKTEARNAVMIRLNKSVEASNRKRALLKLEKNETMVRLIDAKVLAEQAKKALKAEHLKVPVDEAAVVSAKQAADEAVGKVHEAENHMVKVSTQLRMERKHMADLHRRTNQRKTEAEGRHSKDESVSESEAEINRKFPRKAGGRRRRRKGNERT